MHVHTEYSLLDGSAKIGKLLDRAKELEMESLAITDHGNMYGVIDFYKAAKDRGIKPILGCETYLAVRTRHDKEPEDRRSYHLVLLAETNEGYENLVKLVSLANIEGFYRKPRIDIELLKKYHKGIIALGACLAGPVSRKILEESYESAREEAKLLNEIMGQDNFFLEIQDHGMDKQQVVNEQTIRMSQELGIPLVATNDVHYITEEDAAPHEVLLCVQTGKTMSDDSRMVYEGGQFYLKSPDEMSSLFNYIPEALENTTKIAERCNVEIKFHEQKLPKFDVPNGMDATEYMKMKCNEGLHERYENVTQELIDRLNYEMDVIITMGFVDYFLIVSDFIRYAKDNGIPVGPGRGSAAGSIVAYTLYITEIDPIKYDLLFERFLNPERVSMPDIDIDFCYERRQDVIDYVVEKYGKDCVSQIVTFGTLSARMVIRDVGRALEMPYQDVDKIAKMIPMEPAKKHTIKGVMDINKELKDVYDTNPEVRHLLDVAMNLEGLPRHTSMHAAGVLIADRPVMEYVPLTAPDGALVAQYNMTTLEELGLLKMDFLGLRTLTVIKDAVDLVKKNRGIDLDMSKIDDTDQAVYETIASGNTEGIFQLESEGMKNFMRDLQPDCIEDIIAGISLYRPGPMDFIPKYVAGKKDRHSITYTHPKLEPILKDTYGCIVYQEQVMRIVRDLAGYSLGRSDLLRRAMGKKKVEVMKKEREIFLHGDGDSVPGCVANGIDEKTANQIFDEMVDFAKYAFNKSHAAAYAVVAYQTAYLKTHYTEEFMAALMTSVMENSSKITGYIDTCRKMGIEITPPNINKGNVYFDVVDGKIVFSLAALKGVGKGVAEDIASERKEHGPFKSLNDFYRRMDTKDTNKRCVESLILSGCFDCLGGRRSQYMAVYSQIASGIAYNKKNTLAGQIDLFGMLGGEDSSIKDMLPNMPEYDKKEILKNEKEVIGIYVSGHPLDEYRSLLAEKTNITSDRFVANSEEEIAALAELEGRVVTIGGIIAESKVIFTKNNQKMAFVTLEDLRGTIEVVVFPKFYDRFKEYSEDDILFIQGRVSIKDEDRVSVLAEQMTSVREIENANSTDYIVICMEAKDRNPEIRQKLLSIFNSHRGKTRVVVENVEDGVRKPFPPRYNVEVNAEFESEIRNLLGVDCIKFQ